MNNIIQDLIELRNQYFEYIQTEEAVAEFCRTEGLECEASYHAGATIAYRLCIASITEIIEKHNV